MVHRKADHRGGGADYQAPMHVFPPLNRDFDFIEDRLARDQREPEALERLYDQKLVVAHVNGAPVFVPGSAASG